MDLRSILLLPALLLSFSQAHAQRDVITGRIIDKDSGEPLEKATLQLYKITTKRNNTNDTTFVGGAISNERGNFTLTEVKSGNYFLKATFLGFKDYTRKINKTSSQMSLGISTHSSATVPSVPNKRPPNTSTRSKTKTPMLMKMILINIDPLE